MSIVIPDCYDNIIGLTRTDCECFAEMPNDASDSLSGLYIDDLANMQFIQSITDCTNGNDLYINMKKARDNAIQMFQADTNALLQKNYRLRRNPFNGGIGRANSFSNVTLKPGNYYGVRMYCDNVKSGILYIKQIGTIFKDTGIINLMVYNNLGTLVKSIALDTSANEHMQNTVDLELPLYSPYTDHLEYYFIYQLGAIAPKVNDIKCSCGSFKPVFNCAKPYYAVKHETTYGWADWLMVGGVNIPSIPDFADYDECKSDNNLYGLTFKVELKCKIGEVICNEQLDFEGNPLAGAIALAIQNKAGEMLLSWILQSGNINRFTTINAEQHINDIANYKATYQQMIQYIVDTVNITQNDCLACKDVLEMSKRGIFS